MTKDKNEQRLYYPDTLAQALLGQQEAQPQFLVDETNFKVVLRRLDPGDQIPVHPDSSAVYHFLAGTGTMTVDEQQYPITAGVTIITPHGSRRGMQAATPVIFLAAKRI